MNAEYGCDSYNVLRDISKFAVHRSPYLLAFCESGIDVYDVNTSRWLQTLSARKVRLPG